MIDEELENYNKLTEMGTDYSSRKAQIRADQAIAMRLRSDKTASVTMGFHPTVITTFALG